MDKSTIIVDPAVPGIATGHAPAQGPRTHDYFQLGKNFKTAHMTRAALGAH